MYYRVQSVKVIVYCGVVLQIKYMVDRKTDSFLHYSKIIFFQFALQRDITKMQFCGATAIVLSIVVAKLGKVAPILNLLLITDYFSR